MDAIRLKQIEEVMGYDNHINTMVFDMERKRVSHTIRERPEDEYAMIDAQKMMDVNDATNALQLMLDGKLGNLSVMARNSTSVDSAQFGYAAKDVWEVEDVVSKYNELSGPSWLPTARPRCNNTSSNEHTNCCGPSAPAGTA
jgi:hypothetical protein